MSRESEQDELSIEEAKMELQALDLPAALRASPSQQPPPPVVPRAAVLPLRQLAWADFERLLVALVCEVFHWQGVRLYGVKGQAQHGIDLYGYADDGSVRTCQGKDVEIFDKQSLRAAVIKFAKGRRPFESRWLAVAVACSVSRTEVLEELHSLKNAYPDLTLELWDQHCLSDFLRTQHTLVRRFFGCGWERIFCDPLPASALLLHPLEERQQRLDAMRQESLARLVARWISTGIDEALAEEFTADVGRGLPQSLRESLPENGLVLLQGDFGSGKSTAGERLHQEDLARARADVTAPVPVYLTARYVQGALKDAVLVAATSLENPARVGARVVIDGVDEAGLITARHLIEQARILVRLWPNTRCLLTARPFEISVPPECIQMPLLEIKEVRALVQRVAGGTGWIGWPSTLWETARRPLFALVAASLRSPSTRSIPRTTAEFLEALVQNALERNGQLDSGAHAALQRLAALTLSSGGIISQREFGGDADIQRLLVTNLVVRRGRTLAFTLPVIEQYFGAQALLSGVVNLDTVWTPLEVFDRWRDAVCIAVGSGSWEWTSFFLTKLIGLYPGVASSVIKHAISERTFPGGDDGAPEPPAAPECARRIRSALSVWIDAVRPLSEHSRLVGTDGRLVSIAVHREGAKGIVTAWPPETEPTFVSGGKLPYGKGQLPPEEVRLRRFRVVASSEPAWPWMASLGWLRDEFEHVLSSKDLPLRDKSPGRAERRWALARVLMNVERNILHLPIPADIALTTVRHVLTPFSDSSDGELVDWASRRRGDPVVRVKEIREFASDLEAGKGVGADGRLHRPWAVPDNLERWSKWVWGLYSKEAQVRFVHQVYTAALDIYEEVVTTWMPKLRPTLNWACALPIRLTGVMEWRQNDKPSLHYRVSPLPQGAKTEVVMTTAPADFNSAHFELACREVEEGLAILRKRAPAALGWFRFCYQNTAVHLSGNTPATDLAYAWLARHLQCLSLVAFNCGSLRY